MRTLKWMESIKVIQDKHFSIKLVRKQGSPLITGSPPNRTCIYTMALHNESNILVKQTNVKWEGANHGS
jgi:hypothetical protein